MGQKYDAIKVAFVEYFRHPPMDKNFPEVDFLDGILAAPGEGEIEELYPWSISYVVDDADGQRFLEIYAVNRFTNDRHLKIAEDGTVQHLEAPQSSYSYNPHKPGDKERAEQEFYNYNRRVYAELERRGLSD